MVNGAVSGGRFLFFLLPAGVFFFYLAPAFFLFLLGEGGGGLLLMSAAVFAFYFFFWFFKVDLILFAPALRFIKGLGFVFFGRGAVYGVATSYLLFMAYVILTAPTIPLFDAFRGCGIDWLAQGRETFLRTRSGWEASLNYIYSMYRSFLAPLVVCYLYASRDRFRHVFLVAFSVTLFLTLEKSVAIFIFAPLVFLFIESRSYSRLACVACAMLLLIAGAAFLARGGLAKVDCAAQARDYVSDDDMGRQAMSSVPARYNRFKYGGQIGYMVNRVVYIPYITAIDWIRYHRDILHGHYLYGRGISLVAFLSGAERVRMDREVFNFQWGQNSTGTGAANTVFFVDAYVNFGWLGIFFYTLVVVFLVRMVMASDVVGIQAAMAVPMFYLVFNSLTAMIFSGGIFFALFLAVFSRSAMRQA